MPQVMIDLGTQANDRTGSRMRPAGTAINANFSEVYQSIAAQAGRVDGLATFTQAGAGAVGRATAAKLQDVVHVRDFGADPTGVADATLAWQRAFDTGKNVVADGGVYRLSGPVAFKAPRQWLFGRGARVNLFGNFDAFVAGSNLEGCGVHGLYVDGNNQSGGHVFNIDLAPRFTVRDLVCWGTWCFSRVQRQNWCSFENVWCNNIRGPYGTYWYGDNTTGRSDILRFIGCGHSGGPGNRPDGVIMNGALQTLHIQGLVMVNCNRGLWIHNAANASLLPAFVFADDLEIDFPQSDGVRIEAGSDHYFSPLTYVHGSVNGSGFYVGSAVPADRVSIWGGKITGHARYGVENLARIRYANAVMSGNALGNFSNPDGTVFEAPRVQMDPSFYANMSGANPVLNFDASDYMGFNRASNEWGVTIAGAAALTASATVVAASKPVRFPGFSFAGLPAAGANLDGTVRVIDRNNRLATSDGTQWRWTDGAVAT